MNESAGEQLSELINGVLQLPTTDTLDGADESDEPAHGRTTREGLPRSFRMRHDAHYVDELLSVPTAATVTPTRVSATAALALIAGRLESLVAHAAVIDLHQDGATLVARTVQSEFARVARLSRAAVIANDGETLYRGTVSVGEIADEVTRAIAPLARSGGMDCEISVDDRTFTLTADPALVVHALVSTIDAFSELLRSQPRRRALETRQLPARVSFTVQSAKVRPALIVDLTCPSISIAERQADRLFENHDDDYRESAGAGVLLAAAARVARAHGGRADVKRHAVAGVTITFVYPQAPPDSRLA